MRGISPGSGKVQAKQIRGESSQCSRIPAFQRSSPNSGGFILGADYMPWDKWKFSLQYRIYNKFNGARTNYDGFGTALQTITRSIPLSGSRSDRGSRWNHLKKRPVLGRFQVAHRPQG